MAMSVKDSGVKALTAPRLRQQGHNIALGVYLGMFKTLGQEMWLFII